MSDQEKAQTQTTDPVVPQPAPQAQTQTTEPVDPQPAPQAQTQTTYPVERQQSPQGQAQATQAFSGTASTEAISPTLQTPEVPTDWNAYYDHFRVKAKQDFAPVTDLLISVLMIDDKNVQDVIENIYERLVSLHEHAMIVDDLLRILTHQFAQDTAVKSLLDRLLAWERQEVEISSFAPVIHT